MVEKMNIFFEHDKNVFVLFDNMPINAGSILKTQVCPKLPLDKKLTVAAECKHQFSLEKIKTRAGDEIITLFKTCIFCNLSYRL